MVATIYTSAFLKSNDWWTTSVIGITHSRIITQNGSDSIFFFTFFQTAPD